MSRDDPAAPGGTGLDGLRWLARHGWLRPRYARAWLRWRWARVRWPDVEFEGFVFLGRGVQLQVTRGVGRLRIGAWTHLADRVKIRAHEGTVEIGPKCVLGYDLTLNAHLDVRIGEATIVGDRVYVCDFDHAFADPQTPIKDQGLVRSPVRIGPDCWLGTGVTVVRGTDVGAGSVLAAHSVARGAYPERSVIAGVPGTVVADRDERWEAGADGRAYLDSLGQEAAERVRRLVAGEDLQVRLSGQLICRTQDEARAVMQHLPRHVELTRAEPGCLSFRVVRTGDPLVWQVEEHFADEVVFRAHQERAASSDWGRMTASIERRYSITGLSR